MLRDLPSQIQSCWEPAKPSVVLMRFLAVPGTWRRCEHGRFPAEPRRWYSPAKHKLKMQGKQLRTQIALTIASMSMHSAAIGLTRSYMIVSKRCGAGARMNSSICTGSSMDARESAPRPIPMMTKSAEPLKCWWRWSIAFANALLRGRLL